MIGRALRAAIPQLRFVMIPELVDWKATKEAGLLNQGHSGDGPVIATPEDSWIISYTDDLNCIDDRYDFPAWLEPENWRAQWKKNALGHPCLENAPDKLFRFAPCRIYAWPWNNMGGEPPRGYAPNQYLFLAEGSFSGVYYPWEPEKEALLRRVRRVFDKHTTNQCCTVEIETLKPEYVSTKGAEDRIGPAASAWAMAHPRHFLGRDMLKPIEWAAKYPNGWHRS